MSDETQQGSAPEENSPEPQDVAPIESTLPAQESFGPFPEKVNDVPLPASYDNPQFYNTPAANSAPPSYGYTVPPQQGFYGQPPNMFQAQPFVQPGPAAPLPLWAAIKQLPRQYWHVFTNPKPITFIAEERKAAWNIIWMQILILGVVHALFIALIVIAEFLFIKAIMPPDVDTSMFSTALPIVAIVLAIASIILEPVGFFFNTGILHLLAKAFGGQGTFLSYCYNYSLVVVPISIVTTMVAIIPCIGSLAGLAGAVYEIVLLIYMTMGVHRLSGGKASAVVLIPICVAIVLFVGLYVVYFALIFSSLPRH